MMVGRMVPFVVLSPIVGWLADRCNRLHLMLGCDVARGLLVLALAAANTHTTLAALVVLKSLMSALAAQFEPCRSAIVPQVTYSSVTMRGACVRPHTAGVTARDISR